MSSINSNTQKKNNNNFIDASQKESFDANKLIVNIGATSFLTGFLGALWAIKRAESKGTYKDLTPKKMAELDEFARYRIATLFTLKTFALGTILCLSTAGLLTIGIGSWLKVNNRMNVALQNVVNKDTGYRLTHAFKGETDDNDLGDFFDWPFSLVQIKQKNIKEKASINNNVWLANQ
ncbi:8135_t:CDS:2 [Entrophospora sp. SA101]|nr:7939_t:CDS:2 [Entrophospora sp. SA101]CAJ0766832.1 8135_t:CDS:2 [Entrophospora sp. SA101]